MEDEKLALRSAWAADYGVVFAPGRTSQDPQVLEQRRKLNEDSCVACHSAAQHAFASYGLSLSLRPAALDQAGITQGLYYLHYLACFLGLALLPFTKFLHIFSRLILLATNAVVDRKTMDPAARTALRALEMAACSHCGTCIVHCSVAVTLHACATATSCPRRSSPHSRSWSAATTARRRTWPSCERAPTYAPTATAVPPQALSPGHQPERPLGGFEAQPGPGPDLATLC